jgi:hypothetical protein
LLRRNDAYLLSIGDDPNLLHSRHLVLESAGYGVFSTGSLTMLLDPVASRLDAALMCHSVPPKRMESIARILREAHSGLPLLVLSFNTLTPWLDQQNIIRTDTTPHSLIRTIDEVLQAAASSSARVVRPNSKN